MKATSLALHWLLIAVIFAAHLFRAGEIPAAAAALAVPALLLWRRAWVYRLLQAVALAWGAEWLRTGATLAWDRAQWGEPYLRMTLILGVVAGVTAAAALTTERLARPPEPDLHPWLSLTAAAGAVLLLVPVQAMVELKMLLIERWVPGAGWVEISLLALYAGWLAPKVEENSRLWRGRLWTFFSAVFFGQLILGLAGFERFLQTGELHLPVPALVIGGPLYRGEGLFMPILFLATIALAGPTWCSHLCYIGAWDYQAASLKKRASIPGSWRIWGRVVTLAIVVVGAVGMRLAGVSTPIAALLGAAFGLVGVVIMLWASRKWGYMVHCTAWCPLGLVAVTLGKLNPFRVDLGGGCTQCGACTPVCRYDALRPEHLAAGKVGYSCTLCGDCVQRCTKGELQYRFLYWRGENPRLAYIALAVALHSAFLGLARI